MTSSYPTALNTIAGNFVEAQVEGLRKKGLKVDVIALNMWSLRDIFKWISFKLKYPKSEHPGCFYSNSIVNLIPLGSWFHEFWFRKNFQNAISKYLDEHGQPEIVHAHFNLWAGYVAAQCKELSSVPLVITEHSSVYFENKVDKRELEATKLALNRADKVIVLSKFLKNSLCSRFPFAESKMIMIPNFAGDLFFRIDQKPKRENLFVSIGRLVPTKGFDTLIMAFARMKNNSNFKLVIVGEGEEMQSLRHLAKDEGVFDRVQFAGTLTKLEIKEWLLKSKLLISCSHFETFGVSIVEALATGTPVLVTNVGAPSGFVVPEVGEVCKVSDVDDTCRKLEFMMENYGNYNHESIREYALKSFGEDSVLEQIVDVYKTIKQQN